MNQSRFSAELRTSIVTYLSQCGLIIKKDVVQRICQNTSALSKEMILKSLADLVELYESPNFLKIYPNRDKEDGVWDKDLFQNLLSFNQRLKRQKECNSNFGNELQPSYIQTISQSGQLQSLPLDYEKSLNQESSQIVQQKSQSRKLLQKQVLIMDAFIDFPKIEDIHTQSGLYQLKYRDNQFSQFEPIALKSNGNQESRLNYFFKRMTYIRSKVLALRNPKTKNYKYSQLAYNSNVNFTNTDQQNDKPEFLANTQQTSAYLKKKINIIGMLGSNWKGEIFLEDQYGKIKLNLKNAKFQQNVIFNQGSIVIVKGISYEQGGHCQLNVVSLQHPPRQTEKKVCDEFKEPFTKKQLQLGSEKIGNLCDDWFGAELLVSKKIEQLGTFALVNSKNSTPSSYVHLNHQNVTDSIYVISQITRKSLKELSTIFDKMNKEGVPAIIILIGQFNAHASCQVSESMKITKEFFAKLAEMLLDKKQLRAHTQWVIVPGPDDFLPFSALPNVHLSKKLMPRMKKVVSKLKLVTNPCRISYYGKEILICRADFAKLFLMNNILLKHGKQQNRKEANSFRSRDMVETIIRQGNLLPFLKKSQLVLWKYSDCFHFDTLPDCMILADSFLHYEYQVDEGKYIVSPGIFSEHKTFLGIFCEGEKLQAELIDLQKIEGGDDDEDDEDLKNQEEIDQGLKIQN